MTQHPTARPPAAPVAIQVFPPANGFLTDVPTPKCAVAANCVAPFLGPRDFLWVGVRAASADRICRLLRRSVNYSATPLFFPSGAQPGPAGAAEDETVPQGL